jgi:urea transport system permease protein
VLGTSLLTSADRLLTNGQASGVVCRRPALDGFTIVHHPFYVKLRLLLVLLCIATASAAFAQESAGVAAATDAASLTARLPTADYADKRTIVAELVRQRAPGARAVLAALLAGNLYTRDADQQLFIAAEHADKLVLTTPLTGAPAGTVAAAGYSRVGINNQLRKILRAAIAQFDLANTSRDVRLAAVIELSRSIDADTAAMLRQHQLTERDAKVRQQITTAIAIGDLQSDTADSRLAAIAALKGSLDPEVFNRLTTLATVAADGTAADPDVRIRLAAGKALRSIEHWRSFYGVIETLFFGLSLGSVLVLAGIGLAITFGVMGVINMAHGELMMLGAYSVYVVQQLLPQSIGSSVLIAIPVAFLVSGLVGVAIERGIVRFLYGRPLETLLATFGVSLILQQLVRDIFSPNNRPVETPQWMAGSLHINDVLSITYTRLYIVLFTIIVFSALLLVLKKTRLGLEVRAVSQNRAMAKAMGIRTEWVDAMTFGLGSGIAGVAGVALSQLTNVGPNLGQSYIVDSFMVVVFGGVGSLWGTQIGGVSLGVANKLLEPHAGAVLAKILVLIALILFIQRRPRGLFPQKGRAAEG